MASKKQAPKALTAKDVAKVASEARQGHTDAALARLRQLAAAGFPSASGAIAAILSFRGQWDEAGE